MTQENEKFGVCAYFFTDKKLINQMINDICLLPEVRKRKREDISDEDYEVLKSKRFLVDIVIWDQVRKEVFSKITDLNYKEHFGRSLYLALMHNAVKNRVHILITPPLSTKNEYRKLKLAHIIAEVSDPQETIAENIFTDEAHKLSEEIGEDICKRMIPYLDAVQDGLAKNESPDVVWKTISDKYNKEKKYSQGDDATNRFLRYLKTEVEFSYHKIYGAYMQEVILPKLIKNGLDTPSLEYFKITHIPNKKYLFNLCICLLPIFKDMSNLKVFKVAAEALILDPDNRTLCTKFYQTVAGLIKYYNMQSKLKKDRETLAKGGKAAISIVQEFENFSLKGCEKDCYDFTEAGPSICKTSIDDIIKLKTYKRYKFYILHYMHKLSYSEIGERLNVSKQAAQQGCYRAKIQPNLEEVLIYIAKQVEKELP